MAPKEAAITKVVTVAVVAALALTTLTGCASTDSVGPLDLGQSGSKLCAPASTLRDAAWGIDWPEKELQQGITIKSIELLNPQGMQLLTSYFMPQRADKLGIGFNKFAPTDAFAEQWSHAVNAVDSPIDSKNLPLFFMHVLATSNGGSADGARITYTYNGVEYSTLFHMQVVVSTKA